MNAFELMRQPHPCSDCGEIRKVYWAYFFRGRCKECVDKELEASPHKDKPNPFLAMIKKP